MSRSLTSGDLGSYAYGGGSNHVHAVTRITAIGAAYTASYDAAGNMTCRAPSSSTTCSGTPTGAQLTFDNEGRLSAWQNAPSNPTSTTSNLYDGSGTRVEQQTTSGSSGSTTVYVGNIEEVSSSSGATITTTSYDAGGQRIAQAVNGVFSYLGSDGLGSAVVALDANGNPQASTLYDPYGNVRYVNGAMPGSYGFTGQHADGATGLDDYQARYYDPVAGQFISADSVADGLNGSDPLARSRYACVEGNPLVRLGPTGHDWFGSLVSAVVAVVAAAMAGPCGAAWSGAGDWMASGFRIARGGVGGKRQMRSGVVRGGREHWGRQKERTGGWKRAYPTPPATGPLRGPWSERPCAPLRKAFAARCRAFAERPYTPSAIT